MPIVWTALQGLRTSAEPDGQAVASQQTFPARRRWVSRHFDRRRDGLVCAGVDQLTSMNLQTVLLATAPGRGAVDRCRRLLVHEVGAARRVEQLARNDRLLPAIAA